MIKSSKNDRSENINTFNMIRHPIINSEFDSRAFPNAELKERYLNYRYQMMRSIWTGWLCFLFILAWLMTVMGFAGLLLLVKLNPELTQRIINFLFHIAS